MLHLTHYYIKLLIPIEKTAHSPLVHIHSSKLLFLFPSSSSCNMCSMISSQGVVVATAMAVSGTFILFALRLQKSLPVHEILPSSPPPILRSCISSAGKKTKKNKKRVHFAEDVVESCRDGEEFRKSFNSFKSKSQLRKVQKSYSSNGETKNREMPPNRAALYNGILRDRVAQRLAYSC